MHRSRNLSTFLLLLCLLAGLKLSAVESPYDKARRDFKRTNALYAATPVYSLDIQYAVFDSHTGGNLVEQKTGKYIRNNAQSYMQVLNTETVVNPERTIVLNHEDRMIVIADTKKTELSPLQSNTDSLLKWCSSITCTDVGTTERRYTLFFSGDETEFAKIEIAIDLQKYSIKKMVLYYNEEMQLDQHDYYAKEKKPRLEISYKAFSELKTVDPGLFSESTYVTRNSELYKGKGKWAAYEVFNQTKAARFKKK